MTARMIDKNAPHQLRRHAEEVGTVLPANIPPVNQPKINLINQCRGLQGVAGTFLAHVASSQSMQFRLDERNQLLEGRLIAVTPGAKQLGDRG
jgi:hypothetical protein